MDGNMGRKLRALVQPLECEHPGTRHGIWHHADAARIQRNIPWL